MDRVEAAIQGALILWVHQTYGPEIIITATSNEKNYKETRQIGSIGITDLLVFRAHPFCVYILWLELKKKTGKLRETQIEWNENFDANFSRFNSARAVAYGYNEGRNIIEKWVDNVNKRP